jgi:hypothetical protein
LLRAIRIVTTCHELGVARATKAPSQRL